MDKHAYDYGMGTIGGSELLALKPEIQPDLPEGMTDGMCESDANELKGFSVFLQTVGPLGEHRERLKAQRQQAQETDQRSG